MKYTRYVYFINIGNLEISELDQFFIKNSFSEAKGSGYQILRNNRKITWGKFINKTHFIEEIEIPDGSLLKLPRIVYETTQFYLEKNSRILYTINPFRRLDAFWNMLNKINPNEFTYNRIVFRVRDLIDYLENGGFIRSITSLETSSELINETTSTIVYYTSKDDLRNHFKESEFPSIKYIRLVISIDNKVFTTEISNTGRITTNIIPAIGFEKLLTKFLRGDKKDQYAKSNNLNQQSH